MRTTKRRLKLIAQSCVDRFEGKLGMSRKIDNSQLNDLARRGLSLLRLTEVEWMELEATRLRGVRFSLIFPHGVARSGRPKTLVLIAISGEAPDLRLGLIRSVQATATLDSRVVFDLIQPIVPGTLDTLVDGVTGTVFRVGVKKLISGSTGFQPVSEKLGERLIALIAAAPTNGPA